MTTPYATSGGAADDAMLTAFSTGLGRDGQVRRLPAWTPLTTPARHAAERIAREIDPFADLADDLDTTRIVTPEEAALTPDQVFFWIWSPVRRALDRLRRAERAVKNAKGAYARQRADEKLSHVRHDPTVVAVLAADLDADRDTIMPIVRAATAGTSDRWRLCRGRVIDQEGRDLQPMCIRPWQTL